MNSPISRKKMFSPSSSSAGSSPSATIICGHDDLLTEILVLLPAKSLIRFKSVNKHWQFLISADSFARLHLLNCRRRAQTQHSFILGVNGRDQFFICHPAVKKLARVKLPYINPYIEYIKILQSCNGLLLLKIKLSGSDYMFFHVFNPTTIQERCINPVEIIQQDCPIKVCLVFDPSETEYYKVVAFWGNVFPTWFSVYHSATHQWSPMTQVPPVGITIGFSLSDGVLHNLFVYFMRTGEPLYYRFFEEEYSSLFPYIQNTIHFFESNGHLHCLHLYDENNQFCLQMGEAVNREWVLVDHDFVFGESAVDFGGGTMCKIQALGMIREREETIEDSMFLFHVPGQIMIYRFHEEVCEVLIDYRSDYFYDELKLQFLYEDAHPFIHTLAIV